MEKLYSQLKHGILSTRQVGLKKLRFYRFSIFSTKHVFNVVFFPKVYYSMQNSIS